MLGILVGIAGYVMGVKLYTEYQEQQEFANQIVVDDIVGTYTGYNDHFRMTEYHPNPIGFPNREWVIVITKLSDTTFKIDGAISTTGEINNGEITIQPTKFEKGREHIDITYTMLQAKDNDARRCDLSMYVKCVGEAIYKTTEYSVRSGRLCDKLISELKLYDEIIWLELRKVADYDYRIK